MVHYHVELVIPLDHLIEEYGQEEFDDEYAKYSPDHSRHYGIAGKLHDVCEECKAMIAYENYFKNFPKIEDKVMVKCESHPIQPLNFTIDEWQTLRNATFWHSEQATEAEKVRINRIRNWLDEAFNCMMVDTIRLEAIG